MANERAPFAYQLGEREDKLLRLGPALREERVSVAAENALQNPQRVKYPHSMWIDEVLALARRARSPYVREAAVWAIAFNPGRTPSQWLALYDDLTHDSEARVRRAALFSIIGLWRLCGSNVAKSKVQEIRDTHPDATLRRLAEEVLEGSFPRRPVAPPHLPGHPPSTYPDSNVGADHEITNWEPQK